MEWTEDQKQNILLYYDSIEEYERIKELEDAKKYLADTDYAIIKLFEYTLTGQASLTDYKETFKKREAARKTIREKSKDNKDKNV